MASIKVTNHLDDLTRDMAAIPVAAAKRMPGIVRDGALAGAQIARDFARESAGKHGKHYPNAITAEARKAFRGFGAGVYSAEYGPDSARRQGGMSFEWGSRNQPPHLDLNKSADIIGPAFPGEVRNMLRDLFWNAR